MKSDILKEEEKFVEYLTEEGFRYSPGRKTVFKIVMRTHGHFTAEELVKKCTVDPVKTSRATVYRSIKELLEAGIIRETAYGDKHQHYEHVYDEELHHHARCVRCGSMIEFPDTGEEKRHIPVLENQGFHILGHELTFYGICKECNK